MKVTLSRWQIINGVVLEKAIEHEVTDSVGAELKRRGVVIVPKPEATPSTPPAKVKTPASQTPTPEKPAS